MTSLDKLNNESDAITAQWPNDIETSALTASQFTLNQNYPNPFNPVTTIRYSLPEQANVILAIYDISGQLVQTLLADSQLAGHHAIKWSGDNARGDQVSTGVYLCRMTAGGHSQTIKMAYLR